MESIEPETAPPPATEPTAMETDEKSQDTNPQSAAPRRSTRIGSTSGPKAAPTPATEKKKRATRKRTADEAGTEEKPEEASEENESKKAKTEGEAVKTVDIGDMLPGITLKNEKGEDLNVQELASESGVVLFLVPKADTPGCTTQACGFRDIYPDFESVNYKVYCLSADTPTAQSKWQVKKSLPYPLLSDPKRELIKALGAGANNKTARSHFIFEKGGKLVNKKIPVKPADSPKLALEFIKSLGSAVDGEPSVAVDSEPSAPADAADKPAEEASTELAAST